AKTSGWDVAIVMPDMACVFTKDQLASILAIAKTAAPLLKLKSERQEMKTRYQQKFGDRLSDTIAATASPVAAAADTATGLDGMAGVIPELARWVSAKLKHIYVAVVPQPTTLLDGWQDSSLAVLRLKLETVKHLALYLKNIGARWEYTPVSGTKSAPEESSAHVDTELWAAMSREAANRGVHTTHTGDATQPMTSDRTSTTMVSAYIQNVSLYDNDPELHPVVRPLVTVDRSMDITKQQQQQQQYAGSRRAAHNSEKYDVWMCAFESDLVLTVNVGPIVFALNKELADRLGVYQELLASVALTEPTVYSGGSNAFSGDEYIDDVTNSIENLMRNLKISAEQKMASNVAVCSPLIRTWVMLPGTLATGSAKEGGVSSSQIRSRSSKDDQPAPGHFRIDAIDAVITNVVNGTATSSQTQNDVPDGHLRHPHIQELLESRKSVAGSGVRVECETLHVYLQSMEGSSAVEHIASIHGPSVAPRAAFSSIAVPRPHVEITTVAKNSGRRTPAYEAAEQFGRRPPAFDAFSAIDDNIRVRMAPESELSTSLKFERLAVALSSLV
ncbi:hypothetical protein GGI05_006015, partial [Coemansia sp. RSA 2603]